MNTVRTRKKCLLKRGVHLWEVKNVVLKMYVAGTTTKCQLMGGVRSRGSTAVACTLKLLQVYMTHGHSKLTRPSV